MLRTVAAVHRVHVGEDQQHFGSDLPAEHGGDAVLVDDGVDPLEPQHGVVVHRRPAAAARHDDVPGGNEVSDHGALDDRDRPGAGREPAPAARLLFPHRHAPRLQPGHAHGIKRVSDRLGRLAEIGVVRIARRLGDEGDHLTRHRGARQRVLKRLLDHVAHPARRRRHEHAERQRFHLVGGDLGAGQLVSHLGTVAVHQDDAPTVAGQVHDRGKAGARVAELIRDRGPFARRRDGVPAKSDDDGTRLHGGAT